MVVRWAEAIDHDAYNIIIGQLPYIIIIHVEAGCQGHSSLGPKHEFDHDELGGVVPIPEALVDMPAGKGTGREALHRCQGQHT